MDTSYNTVPPGVECGDPATSKTHDRALLAGHASHAQLESLCQLDLVSKELETQRGDSSEEDPLDEMEPCDPALDFDDDGVDDCSDADADGDGVLDASDNCLFFYNQSQVDTDKDGLGDVCDSDADGDGVSFQDDCDDLNPAVSPLAQEVCDGLDNDCDGFVDTPFTDLDTDGLADCVDSDDDGDGVYDVSDNCPLHKNIDQADQDGDGLGDMCDMDADGDGTDAIDDCDDADPIKNPLFEEVCDGIDNDCDGEVDQGFDDTDGDGQADCIDHDDDEDGWLDGSDNCPFDFNPKQEDQDGNGEGDACE